MKRVTCLLVTIGLAGLMAIASANGNNNRTGFFAKEKKTAPMNYTVKMTNVGGTNKFDPETLTGLKVGDQVTFVNEGGTHTATSLDIKTGDPKQTFNTGTMKKGQQSVIVFNSAGTFKYHCEYHGDMTGQIEVTAP